MQTLGTRKSRIAFASTVAGLAALSLMAQGASANPINLGTAGQYSILGVNGGTVDINDSDPSSSIITGQVGIGASESAILNKVTLNGNLLVDHNAGSVSFGSNFEMGSGFTELTGQNLSQAATDANNASSFYASLAHQTNLGNVTGNLSLVGDGGTNVYSLSSLDYNSDVLTLTGNANDMFIFNDSGNFSFAQSQIVLNGINPDQVLFNFTGSDNGHLSVEVFKSASVFAGIILGPDRTIRYHNDGVFDGEIIGQNITIDSGASLEGVPSVPEPGVIGLGSLAMFGLMIRRRRSR